MLQYIQKIKYLSLLCFARICVRISIAGSLSRLGIEKKLVNLKFPFRKSWFASFLFNRIYDFLTLRVPMGLSSQCAALLVQIDKWTITIF
jgi:hypothetical protein